MSDLLKKLNFCKPESLGNPISDFIADRYDWLTSGMEDDEGVTCCCCIAVRVTLFVMSLTLVTHSAFTGIGWMTVAGLAGILLVLLARQRGVVQQRNREVLKAISDLEGAPDA